MHSCITTLLLTLTSLTSARNLAHHADNLWGTSQMQQVDGCLSTDYSLWRTGEYIFFNAPDEPKYDFAISTSYAEYYPATLEHLLNAHNYRSRSKSDVIGAELCGWWDAGAVLVNGRHHGSILWKYSDLRRKPHVPDFGNSTSWSANEREHVPPHLSMRPDDAVFKLVLDILVQNVPYADMLYGWALGLGYACGLLGVLLFVQTLKLFVERNVDLNPFQDAQKSDDIELENIMVHGLSGSGMQRMTTRDDGVDGRKSDIDITTPTSAYSTSSSRGKAADPPPLYSVDGAGR